MLALVIFLLFSLFCHPRLFRGGVRRQCVALIFRKKIEWSFFVFTCTISKFIKKINKKCASDRTVGRHPFSRRCYSFHIRFFGLKEVSSSLPGSQWERIAVIRISPQNIYYTLYAQTNKMMSVLSRDTLLFLALPSFKGKVAALFCGEGR